MNSPYLQRFLILTCLFSSGFIAAQKIASRQRATLSTTEYEQIQVLRYKFRANCPPHQSGNAEQGKPSRLSRGPQRMAKGNRIMK